jgi:hypothetical protein
MTHPQLTAGDCPELTWWPYSIPFCITKKESRQRRKDRRRERGDRRGKKGKVREVLTTSAHVSCPWMLHAHCDCFFFQPGK